MRAFKQRALANANFALLLKMEPRTYFPLSSPRCRNAGLPPPGSPVISLGPPPATERKQNNTKLCHARAALGDPVRIKTYATSR
jgi:hypothetical protein